MVFPITVEKFKVELVFIVEITVNIFTDASFVVYRVLVIRVLILTRSATILLVFRLLASMILAFMLLIVILLVLILSELMLLPVNVENDITLPRNDGVVNVDAWRLDTPAFFEKIVLPDRLEKFMIDVVKLFVVALDAIIVEPVALENTRLCSVKYVVSLV